MSIIKEIEIKVNQAQAIGDINKLYKKLTDVDKENEKIIDSAEEVGKTYEETSKEAVKGIDKQSKAMKGLTSVSGGVKKGFSAIGTAFKAMGIGLLVALVAKLTQVLSENQKVVDFVSTVSTAFSIVINDLINKFSDIFSKISEATGGFDALGKVVGGTVKIAFNALKATVLTLQAGFTYLKLAYEKVFGDDKGVLKAQKDLDEIAKKLKDTAEDTAKQGKKVLNNVGEAVGEVVNGVSILVKDGIKAIGEVDAKGAFAQAEAITRNKKNFELLALQQARLQLQFQNEAELQRQIRDDVSKSVAERIAANDKLGGILDKQFKAEKATIQARIAGLQNEQNLLGFTQERYNEIYQLQTDLIDVEERLNGARSEQLTNTTGLLQEQKDLLQSQVDTTNELAIKQKEFDAEQQETELLKLEKLKEKILLEQQIAKDELERKKLLYEENTQNRVDAENEYLLKKQEIDNAIVENTKAKAAEEKRIEQETADAKLEIQNAHLDNVSSGISLLKVLGEKSKGLQKAALIAENAAGIAKTIINTVAANAKAVAASPLTAGQPFVGINSVSAGIGIASSIAATVKGLKELGGGGVSGGGSLPSGGGAAAPSFNLVQGTGSNQIAESLTTERQPLQAYVVASNVTSAQELDRNAINEASIG
jgi:hypothetical protein